MNDLGEIGEDALIKRLIDQLDACNASHGDLVVGPGDDCAVVDLGLEDRYQLLKTDAMVEGIHYLKETAADKVGWKAIARVISDFAAMGGLPAHLLVTIAMPADKSVQYLEKLYQGMQQCASEYGATICGGETSAAPQGGAAFISVAGTGWVEKSRCVNRGGGQAEDLILVTGRLGGSIRGKHLSFTPRINEARWLTENFQVHSMMDLSDGLGIDLPRLASASHCGYIIDEKALPLNDTCSVSQALGDGEDYELLFTASAETVSELIPAWTKQYPELLISVVGKLCEDEQVASPGVEGWEHFKSNK